MALASETLEGLKGRLEAWIGTLNSQELRVNVKKTKMISRENAGKVTTEGKFPCAFCRKRVGSNSILCQFCSCLLHKRFSGIRGKLKEDSKLKCQTCANLQRDIAEDCPGIELIDQSLETVEKFCYLGDTIGAREGGFDSVITRIRSGWCNFRDLVPFLAGRSSPLEAKGRLYSAYVCSVMLYESAKWSVNKEDVIRLGMNDARTDGCAVLGLSIGFLQMNLGLESDRRA